MREECNTQDDQDVLASASNAQHRQDVFKLLVFFKIITRFPLNVKIVFFFFRYTIAWIKYYNNTDERMPKSIWRYTCDYPVIGIRDISDLDDKSFVRQRRKRNTIVTIMYFIVLLAFIFSLYFIASLLVLILS